jgi:hypothetical protein
MQFKGECVHQRAGSFNFVPAPINQPTAQTWELVKMLTAKHGEMTDVTAADIKAAADFARFKLV